MDDKLYPLHSGSTGGVGGEGGGGGQPIMKSLAYLWNFLQKIAEIIP